MRVLALTRYGRLAPSARQRFYQYIPYLRGHGIEVDVSPLLDDSHMERAVKGRASGLPFLVRAYLRRLRVLLTCQSYDVLWVQYEFFPFLPSIFERLGTLWRKPIVVDFDDAVFHVYDQHRSAFVRWMLGRKMFPLLKAAAACTCGNAYLKSYVEKLCPRTSVIPTVVDTDRYGPPASPDRPLVVGWMGSPSTWTYLAPKLDLLRDVARENGATFRAVGAGAHAENVPGIEAATWSEETEVDEIRSMSVGVMPLPNDSWAQGKCGYKLIQYMACGVPVVASPVGVNVDLVDAPARGLLAETENEWREALTALLSDAELRSRMGERGRRAVVESYSLQSQSPRVRDVILAAGARS